MPLRFKFALLMVLPLAGSVLVVPALATGQSRVDTTGDYLQRIDSDGDGRVSLDEYLAWMGYAFERMDADGDGVLSATELPGNRGRPITREHHQATLAARFRRQDLDGDGFLDARELGMPPAR